MNTPATIDPQSQDNSLNADDLVLRFVGGENDGESVSISTQCCSLAVTPEADDNESVPSQCAVYRGPAGAAVQAHGDEVLVNGESKSVHWLKQGDQIQVADSQTAEVVQLGRFEGTYESAEPDEQTEAVTETPDTPVSGLGFVSHAIGQEVVSEQSSFSEAVSDADSCCDDSTESCASESVDEAGSVSDSSNEGGDERLESLESSVGQLHDQAANVDRRFDRLEDSLNALTEHLDRLAVGSLSTASVAATPAIAAALIDQPAEDAPVATEVVETEEVATADEVEVVDTPVADENSAADIEGSAGDNYEKSIATLFNDLSSDDQSSNGFTADSASTDESAAVGTSADSFTGKMLQSMQDDSPTLSSDEVASVVGLGITKPEGSTEVEASESTEAQTDEPVGSFTGSMMESMQGDSPTLSSDEIASVVGLGITKPEGSTEVEASESTEAQTDEPAGSFTGSMMESMQGDSPTLSSDEVASVVGLGISKPEESTEASSAVEETPVAAAAPVASREPMRTESVAEIFARLQSGASATEGIDEGPSPEAPIRQTVQTTFEDVQASVTAALDAEIPAVSETGVEVDVVEQVAAESVETATPADESSSLMDRFRASLEDDDEGSENSEAPAGAEQSEDSVDDYMSMLMSRMNGDSDSSTEAVSQDVEITPSEGGGVLEKAAIETLLTEEEFTPSAKAAPIKSLDKMRELANSTSRSAVQRSEKAQQIERKKSLVLQSLALGSLVLTALMIWANSYIFGGAFFLIFFVTSAYFVYDTVAPSRAQDVAAPSKKSSKKPATEEPTPDSSGN